MFYYFMAAVVHILQFQNLNIAGKTLTYWYYVFLCIHIPEDGEFSSKHIRR